MKKLIYTIIIALLVTAFPINVLAAQEVTATVTSSEKSVDIGKTVTFTVNLENSEDVYAVMVTPQYDKNLFTLVEGEWLIEGLVSDFNINTGDGVITWENITNINGSLFSFTLKANENLSENAFATIGCHITVMDSSDKPVQYPSAKAATVRIIANKETPLGLRGDVNKNNQLDTEDYLLLKRAYLGTVSLDDSANLLADVNNNGRLDAVDYIMLKRVFFGTYAIPEDVKFVY